MNKKGISPLISTLLLIFFAAALGIVVMSWGKTAQLEKVEAAACDKVCLDIVKIAGEPQLCYSDGVLRYTLENTGAVYIDGLKLFIVGDEIEKIEQDAYIAPADIVNLESAYETKTTIKKVKITPGIVVGEGREFCPKKGVEVDSIKECG
ncbi:hypothetical protein KY361_04500 [Candidatus Woesearchaeota archaeon]|nr:hypothetical protein [Candidatus Woesearchaeota archaeon]